MTFKDHEKVFAEAYEMLEPLLVGFYNKSYEESYHILRDKIEAKLRSKDININYRSMFIDDLEDLILTVIFRLISVNNKSITEKGERIRNPELMAYKITELVYLEELREIRKRLQDRPIDDNGSDKKTLQIPQPTGDEIQAIMNDIVQECYNACLKRLPSDSRNLFLSYYPNIKLDSKELVARRKQLANEEANMTQTRAQNQTPEQEDRIINNLQSKVNKLRKIHVEEFVKKCVEAKGSWHTRLNYLSQQ